VAEAVARLRAGQAEAFALSRDTLRPVLQQIPGSRIVSGGFQQTQVAVAVPQGRPGALACVTDWLEVAKRTGVVRRIFDAHGFGGDAVAS
jgi:polar amino acid transport system substrate-binding protein